MKRMNFKARALMLAKAISVWWGIFVIIGCCMGFSLKIITDIFYTVGSMEKFDVRIFVFLLISGSFVLAIIFYTISWLIHARPERKLRKGLNKILNEKGICKEYIDTLCLNCKGTMKNKIYIELSLAYSALGNPDQAFESLSHIDIVSVLDVAQSTGNFCTAAYYYAAAMLIFLQQNNNEKFKAAYESGCYYINQLTNDSFIMAVKAFYLLKTGNAEGALQLINKAGIKKLQCLKSNLVRGFVLSSRAYVLYSIKRYDEAEKDAFEALNFKISPVIENYLRQMIRKIREKETDNSDSYPFITE